MKTLLDKLALWWLGDKAGEEIKLMSYVRADGQFWRVTCLAVSEEFGRRAKLQLEAPKLYGDECYQALKESK